jgi:integral membrane protein (TIGR01906 family)
VVAMSFALSGLVALAIVFGGTGTYESIMRPYAPTTFHVIAALGPRTDRLDLSALVSWHNAWFAYVTGDADGAPLSVGVDVFTAAEYSHMADVRRVFIGARIVAIVAAVVAALFVVRVARRSRRAAVALARDAAIAASIGTAIIAVAAAVAFDPLFLLFHEILFPQGNFLFPPDSNLLAMYPDQYWYGVTLRVGLAFVGAMVVIASASAATLRQARR